MPRMTTSLLTGLLAAALLAGSPAWSQEVTREDIVRQLSRFETAPALDLTALKQQTQERSKMRGRNEPPPSKRAPIAPELMTLPTFNADIQFDVDTPIVRPESYQAVGRIADAMVYADLLPYTFLIVGHIEANGKRESNVILSQRRADAIRDILANTFKISVKRLQSIGLGEEQLLDPAKPTAPINQQIQIITVAKTVEEAAAPAPAAAPAAPSKQAPRKRRN
ncbi:OmpA family protein [Bradyrhizobium sp. STM 3809]|uniref:OmpA family protein n=1 Tax=Bradyrhizobium sp. STM 3809 TaxID=551936 RepID=UPI000240A278|nr:OmpA family protein [Bradyrhizobium sp. STM 3809]CCE02106.1 putative outer membrane protein [Bradyrhizobium sp. STM 3809]